MRQSAHPAVLGIDVGGTFTDFLLDVGGKVLAHKVLSTPPDFAKAVEGGTAELLAIARSRGILAEGRPVQVRHGTTVATNAFLERRGARVALLVTAGFEDILEIGRQNRPALYDLDCERPAPIVARGDSFGIRERLAAGGAVLEALDLGSVDDALMEAARRGIGNVAISFLHSFANPAHEQAAAARARERGFAVSVSSELLPELREYERTATTALNAYVDGVVTPYLADLETRLAASGARSLFLLGSHGALMSAEVACRQPVDLLLSGPAGGVAGACHAAFEAGFECVLGYDMGGTSTDVALAKGRPLLTHSGTLDGIPLHRPRLDIHTVGAGGGSLAWIDSGGALRVGPASAGVTPGPACYSRGGTEPTTTDANLVLGRLHAEHFLGGRMPLDVAAARGAVEGLAGRLGASVDETALEILTIANVTMARALRRISVERGHDLRDFTLVAFGGAGGLHAAELAAELGVASVLVPVNPGVLSAAGMARASLAAFESRTVMQLMPATTDQADAVTCRLDAEFLELQSLVMSSLESQGLARDDQDLHRYADMRYAGQAYELEVDAGDGQGARVPSRDLVRAFHDVHRQRFGFDAPEAGVQLVTVRVHGSGRPPPAGDFSKTVPQMDGAQARMGTTETLFASDRLTTQLYLRSRLLPGDTLTGPAIVLEDYATTLLPPGFQLTVDCKTNLNIEVMP